MGLKWGSAKMAGQSRGPNKLIRIVGKNPNAPKRGLNKEKSDAAPKDAHKEKEQR